MEAMPETWTRAGVGLNSPRRSRSRSAVEPSTSRVRDRSMSTPMSSFSGVSDVPSPDADRRGRDGGLLGHLAPEPEYISFEGKSPPMLSDLPPSRYEFTTPHLGTSGLDRTFASPDFGEVLSSSRLSKAHSFPREAEQGGRVFAAAIGGRTGSTGHGGGGADGTEKGRKKTFKRIFSGVPSPSHFRRTMSLATISSAATRVAAGAMTPIRRRRHRRTSSGVASQGVEGFGRAQERRDGSLGGGGSRGGSTATRKGRQDQGSKDQRYEHAVCDGADGLGSSPNETGRLSPEDSPPRARITSALTSTAVAAAVAGGSAGRREAFEGTRPIFSRERRTAENSSSFAGLVASQAYDTRAWRGETGGGDDQQQGTGAKDQPPPPSTSSADSSFWEWSWGPTESMPTPSREVLSQERLHRGHAFAGNMSGGGGGGSGGGGETEGVERSSRDDAGRTTASRVMASERTRDNQARTATAPPPPPRPRPNGSGGSTPGPTPSPSVVAPGEAVLTLPVGRSHQLPSRASDAKPPVQARRSASPPLPPPTSAQGPTTVASLGPSTPPSADAGGATGTTAARGLAFFSAGSGGTAHMFASSPLGARAARRARSSGVQRAANSSVWTQSEAPTMERPPVRQGSFSSQQQGGKNEAQTAGGGRGSARRCEEEEREARAADTRQISRNGSDARADPTHASTSSGGGDASAREPVSTAVGVDSLLSGVPRPGRSRSASPLLPDDMSATSTESLTPWRFPEQSRRSTAVGGGRRISGEGESESVGAARRRGSSVTDGGSDEGAGAGGWGFSRGGGGGLHRGRGRGRGESAGSAMGGRGSAGRGASPDAYSSDGSSSTTGSIGGRSTGTNHDSELSVSGSSDAGSPARKRALADRRMALIAASMRASAPPAPPPPLLVQAGDSGSELLPPIVTRSERALTDGGLASLGRDDGVSGKRSPHAGVRDPTELRRASWRPPGQGTDTLSAAAAAAAAAAADAAFLSVSRQDSSAVVATANPATKLPGGCHIAGGGSSQKEWSRSGSKATQAEVRSASHLAKPLADRSSSGRQKAAAPDGTEGPSSRGLDDLPPAEMSALGDLLACALCGVAETSPKGAAIAAAAGGGGEGGSTAARIGRNSKVAVDKRADVASSQVQVERCSRCRRGCCESCFLRLSVYCRGPNVVVPVCRGCLRCVDFENRWHKHLTRDKGVDEASASPSAKNQRKHQHRRGPAKPGKVVIDACLDRRWSVRSCDPNVRRRGALMAGTGPGTDTGIGTGIGAGIGAGIGTTTPTRIGPDRDDASPSGGMLLSATRRLLFRRSRSSAEVIGMGEGGGSVAPSAWSSLLASSPTAATAAGDKNDGDDATAARGNRAVSMASTNSAVGGQADGRPRSLPRTTMVEVLEAFRDDSQQQQQQQQQRRTCLPASTLPAPAAGSSTSSWFGSSLGSAWSSLGSSGAAAAAPGASLSTSTIASSSSGAGRAGRVFVTYPSAGSAREQRLVPPAWMPEQSDRAEGARAVMQQREGDAVRGRAGSGGNDSGQGAADGVSGISSSNTSRCSGRTSPTSLRGRSPKACPCGASSLYEEVIGGRGEGESVPMAASVEGSVATASTVINGNAALGWIRPDAGAARGEEQQAEAMLTAHRLRRAKAYAHLLTRGRKALAYAALQSKALDFLRERASAATSSVESADSGDEDDTSSSQASPPASPPPAYTPRNTETTAGHLSAGNERGLHSASAPIALEQQQQQRRRLSAGGAELRARAAPAEVIPSCASSARGKSSSATPNQIVPSPIITRGGAGDSAYAAAAAAQATADAAVVAIPASNGGSQWLGRTAAVIPLAKVRPPDDGPEDLPAREALMKSARQRSWSEPAVSPAAKAEAEVTASVPRKASFDVLGKTFGGEGEPVLVSQKRVEPADQADKNNRVEFMIENLRRARAFNSRKIEADGEGQNQCSSHDTASSLGDDTEEDSAYSPSGAEGWQPEETRTTAAAVAVPATEPEAERETERGPGGELDGVMPDLEGFKKTMRRLVSPSSAPEPAPQAASPPVKASPNAGAWSVSTKGISRNSAEAAFKGDSVGGADMSRLVKDREALFERMITGPGITATKFPRRGKPRTVLLTLSVPSNGAAKGVSPRTRAASARYLHAGERGRDGGLVPKRSLISTRSLHTLTDLELVWNRQRGGKGSLRVRDVSDVLPGPQSQVLQPVSEEMRRKAAKRGGIEAELAVHGEEDTFVSLVTPQRTLDLKFSTAATRDQFLQAFKTFKWELSSGTGETQKPQQGLRHYPRLHASARSVQAHTRLMETG